MNKWFVANKLTLNLDKNKYKCNQIYNLLNVGYNDE
jgi:hypothetical protein